MENILTFRDVTHIYHTVRGELIAAQGLSFSVGRGEFVAIIGPSGCGKTTTLRMIAGLEDITKGNLYINGEYANYKPSKDRKIAIVFQSYALYPQMNVYENMAFPLTVSKFSFPVVAAELKACRDALKILQQVDAAELVEALRMAADTKATGVESVAYLRAPNSFRAGRCSASPLRGRSSSPRAFYLPTGLRAHSTNRRARTS